MCVGRQGPGPVGGGIAMPPIRCAIWYALEHRECFGTIRSSRCATDQDLVFHDELKAWSEIKGVRVVRCVDPGGCGEPVGRRVGLVPGVLERVGVDAQNAVALVIGPPDDPLYTPRTRSDGASRQPHLHEPREVL